MAHHLVHRLRVELRVHHRPAAAGCQETVSRFAREQLPALLEELLDAHFPDGVHHRLDRLEIDLGRIPLSRMHTALAELLPQALERAPSNAGTVSLPPAPAAGTTGDQRGGSRETAEPAEPSRDLLDAFLTYLQTGTLPWWMARSRWQEESPGALLGADVLARLRQRLVQALQPAPERALRLLPYPALVEALFVAELPALAQTAAFTGFMQSLSPRQQLRWKAALWCLAVLPAAAGPARQQLALGKLLESTLPVTPPTAPGWFAAFGRFRREAAGMADAQALRVVEELARRIGRRALEPEAEELPEPVEAPNEPHRPPDGSADATREGLATASAGLVLLHPFLPRMFQHLDWLADPRRLRAERRWHAIQLLHWLAHGRTGAEETELVLERILCGIPLSEPGDLPELETGVLLEGGELLRSVIGHWGALKNTTPAGLQEAFLARPGLLCLAPSPTLRVETRAYDVLLRRLPWALDQAFLPWLRQPLKIHWPVP